MPGMIFDLNNNLDNVDEREESAFSFYTPKGFRRPVRLSEETRRFAYESLGHKYGLDTRKTDAIVLDDEPGFESLSPYEKYDLAVRRIAENAPVRICEGEKLSCAATLGAAIRHVVPATYKGQTILPSLSHLTADFDRILTMGLGGLRAEAEEALERYKGTEKEPFARSAVNTLDSFEIWLERYVNALEEASAKDQRFAANLNNLRHVPYRPARNFYEAVQSIWAEFAFLRLCGNWPGIGRIDRMLGKYLEADLSTGAVTYGEAREILAHFFIKGCEWICGGDYGSGDAQHYQNLVIGGIDAEGREVTNDVTYLVLDVIEELGISDFPTTVRLSANSPEKLLKCTAEVTRLGGGTVAVYNEDLIIETLTGYGYPLKDAREFANDGCWEVQVPGTTDFSYLPFDSLAILQHTTLNNYDIDGAGARFPDFESLISAYESDLAAYVERLCGGFKAAYRFGTDGEFLGWNPVFPCTAVSLFERGCVERGLSYLEGGPEYRIRSPHIGGLADTVNSLYALKKAVYDDKLVRLDEFLAILRSNWEDSEPLRRYMLNKYTYYGADNDEVDAIAARILTSFADACDAQNKGYGYRFPAGVSTFGRQLEWAPHRLAAPHGRKKGEVLAANCSPTPGTDTQGATAIVRSYCKCPLKRTVTGAALDIRLMPSCVSGEDGLNALIGLMRGFVSLGGFFMQIDVVDAAILHDAQEHPEEHQTLSVRVSGWNARFVTLNKEWQDMVIGQAEGGDKTFGGCGQCG